MARGRGLEFVRRLLPARARPTGARGEAGPPGVEIPRRLGEALVAATRLDPGAPLEDLEVVEVGSEAEYRRHVEQAAPVLRRRLALERLLAAPQAPFRCAGWDACVGEAVEFEVDFAYAYARDEDGLLLPNWRERLVSPRTRLNSRQRATVLLLRRALSARDPAAIALYATEAVTPLFAWLRREYPGVLGSEYLGEAVPPGAVREDGVRHEDLTRLSFPDASLDAVVSCDVLEHVPDWRRGLRELRRVLRGGGTLLLSAPFRADRTEHLVRARVTAAGVEHLEPPEYHGDPVNPEGGVLCFQHFGWKLLEDLGEAGFRTAGARLVWSYPHGILGANQVFFEAVA